MSKIFSLLAAILVAFFLGFVGLYFAMPMLAPEQVAQTQRHLDSLALTRGFEFENQDPLMMYDSLNALRAHLDSLVSMGEIVNRAIEGQEAYIRTLEDSISATKSRMNAMENEHDEVLSIIDELMKRVRTLEAKRLEVKNMSKTLSKLEDKALRAIISQTDPSVLELLYLEATDRERQAIIAALPADRAARFVGRMVKTAQPGAPANNAALEEAPMPPEPASPVTPTTEGV